MEAVSIEDITKRAQTTELPPDRQNGNGIDPEEEARSWPEPRPLPRGLLPVPSLPETLLPESLRPWLVDIAERLQIPLEFPAVPAIVTASSLIGNQVRIRPKRRDDWMVVPNLWGAIIGRPGVLKSPAIAEVLKQLYRLVKEAEEAHKEDLKKWRFDKQRIEVERSALKERMKQAAKKGRDLESFREELSEEEPDEPTERRYLTNDTTVEKYGELLNQNRNGLLIFRDELTGWLRSLDDEQRSKDRAFYLEAWDGDKPFTYDRIGRGTLKIETTTTSILGGIQPGPLESYLRNALGYGEGDDGLLQRFQVTVYPDLPADASYIDEWPDTEAKNQAFDILKRLSELDIKKLRCSEDDQDRRFLHFSDEAQEAFAEWYLDLTRSLRQGNDHPALESHFSKYRSLMPSLALIFELCDAAAREFKGFKGCVSLESTQRAAAWCSFLEKHARRIYGLGLASAAIHAKTLARHLQKGDMPDGFRARELYRNGWAGLATAKAVEQPLEILVDFGWLEARSQNTGESGGRPTVFYYINPKIKEVKL